MIIGHVGLALAARGRWPRVSLPFLVGATMLPDILRTGLQVSGHTGSAARLSHAFPWFLAVAVIAGVGYYLARRDARGALVIAALVLSHVALDMISGGKHLLNDGEEYGLGLAREHPLVEFLIEASLLVSGAATLRTAPVSSWMHRRRALSALLVIQATYLTTHFRLNEAIRVAYEGTAGMLPVEMRRRFTLWIVARDSSGSN